MDRSVKEASNTVRSARLLWIFAYIQRKKVITQIEVSHELGICKRTFNRYIDTLREAGAVIDYVRGGEGPGYKFYCWDAELAPIRGVRSTIAQARKTIPSIGVL